MHYVHLGHVGLVSNCHWRQIVSYVVGWPKSPPEEKGDVVYLSPAQAFEPVDAEATLFSAR